MKKHFILFTFMGLVAFCFSCGGAGNGHEGDGDAVEEEEVADAEGSLDGKDAPGEDVATEDILPDGECPTGETLCDGVCKDTNVDPANCGECGSACTVANGTPACSDGSCSIASCGTPYDDCDDDYTNGCETDTGDDLDNCGECDNACTVENGTPACSDRSCSIASCDAPYDDCNGGYANGCETDTGDDLDNCGWCDNACTVENGTPACSDGSCSIASCAAPYDDCDESYANGCESDTSSDSDNCGECDIACTTTTGICESSQCLTGTICIHAGEMTTPGSYGPGPVYATICDVCTLGDFSLCPRFLVCNYTPPQCGGCISGLRDGSYTLAVFIDTDGNADPLGPLPDSGDAIASSCNSVVITGGGSAATTFIVLDIVL